MAFRNRNNRERRLASQLHPPTTGTILSASDNDRISYLAGEDVEALAPGERAELDELRSLLDDEEVWTEPPLELEDRVVTAIAERGAGDAAKKPDAGSHAAPAPARQGRPANPS